MKFSVLTAHRKFCAFVFPPAIINTCLVASVCLTVFLPVPGRAVTLAPTAKLLPPETIVLIDVDDFNQLQEQFKKTNFYRLYKDPAMKAFIDNFKTKWDERDKKVEDEIAWAVTDVETMPEGRFSIAMVLSEQTKDANEPPMVFVTQWSKSIDKIKEEISKNVEDAVEKGIRRKNESYRGVDITVMLEESSEVISFCFIDDCLIGSMNLDVLKFVIAKIKGAGSSTLADDREFNSTFRALESGSGQTAGKINLYVNIKHLVKMALAEDTSGEGATQISNLGLDNIMSFCCSVDLGSGPGGSSNVKALLKVDGAKRGICKMLELDSAGFRPPQFISTEACSVSFVNLNIKKAFDELANILTRFSPEAAALFYMPLIPASPDGEPAVQIKADVVDHIGSQIVIAQSIDRTAPNVEMPNTAHMPVANAIRSLIAVAINNRSALEKSLSRLHSTIIAQGNPDARRQLLGHTIYLLDPATIFPGFGGGPMTPMQTPAESDNSMLSLTKPTQETTKLAFTVTNTHLLFASEPVVEQAVRSLGGTGGESVASKDWFRKAKSNVPSAVGLASFQDDKTSTEYIWSTMRKMSQAEKERNDQNEIEVGVGLRPGGVIPELMFERGGEELFKFGLLPEYDAIRKYFGLSVLYGVSRPDGFFFEFKYVTTDSNN